METVIIYMLKSSAIMAVFYLCYHFLVQKETFFNTNRWFLLLGLLSSVLLPLFFIKKIVYIEPQPALLDDLPVETAAVTLSSVPNAQIFDWFAILPFIYLGIGCLFLLKIICNLASLYNLLRKQEIVVQKPFAFVDVRETINPFSFFKFIVFNSNLYSKTELDNILNHEKVHSREKHSIDVLIAKLFCAAFWFSPIVWLYKKDILQNLEYIADQKAIQHIEDKKAYQMVLLKVVTDHNYLSITNSFYQSLIKKRIVMLNRNQSKKNKIWKYAVILPVLIAFVIFFQVKVIAQEKNKKNSVAIENTQVSIVIVTKNSSNEELAEDSKRIKKYADIDLKFSRIKRNGKGEITAISASFNDNKGSKGQHKVDGDEPIAPFEFIAKKFNNGQKEIGFIDTLDKYDISNDDIVLAPMEEIAEMTEITEIPEMPELEELDEIAESSYEINSNLPSPPSPPSPPSMKNMPAPPSPPNFPEVPYVKVPTNPSDRKAWAKYEAAMDKFAQDWENGPEMKKFQSQMDAYEKKMEKYQPDMSAFEKEMKKYEAKMEKYHHQMKAYHDAHREKTQEIQSRNQARTEAQREAMEARIEAQRDAIEARTEAQREAIEARIEAQREAIEARREAMEARREAMEARREAIEAKKEAEKKSGNPKDN